MFSKLVNWQQVPVTSSSHSVYGLGCVYCTLGIQVDMGTGWHLGAEMSYFEQFWCIFKRSMGVNWTQRHMDTYVLLSYSFREISWCHWDCFRIQNPSRDWCGWCQPKFPQCTEKMDLWAGWVWTLWVIINCSWPEYWPLIGQHWSRDLNTGLWLVITNCSWKKISAPAVWWQ